MKRDWGQPVTAMDLARRLSEGPIILADGATGTMLQAAGLLPGAAAESWNIDKPDQIRALHAGYIHAGAEAILTNTFGGSSIRLSKAGVVQSAEEVNLAASRIARDVAGDEVFVLGDIGPTGKLMQPLGDLEKGEARRSFFDQARALAKGGVDGILVETMSDLDEAVAAVEGAREASDLPIIVTMSFDTHGRTMMGVTPEQAAERLSGLHVDAIGANCGRTLPENLEAIRRMRLVAPSAILAAKPNAGLPHQKDSESVYDVSPQVLADFAARFAAHDVRLFGGCCGTTPDHIMAVARALGKRE